MGKEYFVFSGKKHYSGKKFVDRRLMMLALEIQKRNKKRAEQKKEDGQHKHVWVRDQETWFEPNLTWPLHRKTYVIYRCCGQGMERVWRMAIERCECGETKIYRVCKAARCQHCGKDFNVPLPPRNPVYD